MLNDKNTSHYGMSVLLLNILDLFFVIIANIINIIIGPKSNKSCFQVSLKSYIQGQGRI